jgi:hypothetical protein
MRGLAATAGVLRRDCGLQRGRKDGSDEREQQQKSGGQALHGFEVNQNPKVS